MANLELAIAFVRSHGDAVEQARLRHLLTGEPASAPAVDAVAAGQRADGGWALSSARDIGSLDISSLDAARFRLALAEQLGIAGSDPVIRHAVVFLARRQRADGSWEEDCALAPAAPPWAKPGDERARLYLTANCGSWLAVLGVRSEDIEAAARAAGYLKVQLREDGSLPSYAHAHWLAGALWFRLGMVDLAERVFNHLGKSVLATFPASNLAWLLTSLRLAGVPPTHPLADAAVFLLEKLQDTDGRWPSEDGPAYDVHTTLEAVRALYGRSQPGDLRG